jgi:hypothetical protein
MEGDETEEKQGKPNGLKQHQRNKMTSTARTKAAGQELEVLLAHPLLDILENPNPIQYRWQFVYSFVANINLTGWGYIVYDYDEEQDRMLFYSLPTTWVRPIHEKGPFAEFKIVDPNKPLSSADNEETLTREQVAFAYLPDPQNPMRALAPAQSQMKAVRIDDHIQTSQERFFDNGIFPSVIVTVGSNPHPDVPAGVRRRLSPAQRRQVHAAIRKTMGGVANYGNPAIIDGLIEKIERLSNTSTEMGWDKSEQATRTRLLSAFGVHPYILGEPVGVGGYAQVVNIEKRFFKRVNTFLDMLGCVMTHFAGPLASLEDDLLVWWEECEPVDPQLRQQFLLSLRKNSDISQNEIRSEAGFPPDEDRNEDVIGNRATQIVQLLGHVGTGKVSYEQALATLQAMGLPTDQAEEIAGKGRAYLPEDSLQQEEDREALEEAVGELGKAVELLRDEPQRFAERVEACLH